MMWEEHDALWGNNDEHHAQAQLSSLNNLIQAVFLCCKHICFFLPLISFPICREGEMDAHPIPLDFADRQ